MTSYLERLSNEYERAETSFLEAVRTGTERADLAEAARRVAVAAGDFNAAAYHALHAGVENAWMPLDHLTERTEVLAELWLDLASAYEA